MISDSNILLYLDESLIKNMASLYLDGYIEIQTFKRIYDISLSGRYRYTERYLNFYEDRVTKNKREGYRDKMYSDVYNFTIGKERENCIENRGTQRIEEETKRIYTSFMLHNHLITALNKKSLLNNFSNADTNVISSGQIVTCSACILPESILDYLSNIISIIKSIGFERLNTLLKRDSLINFESVLNIFSDIYDKLASQGTIDIMAKCKNNDLVMTSIENCFLNQQSHKYDALNCDCTFVGKVLQNCNHNNQSIHMLRKTGNQDFYENMINICLPVIETLKKIGIRVPSPPRFKINNNPIQVKPLSIYI